MIKPIKSSDLDYSRLSQILTPIDKSLENFDFSNFVVNKPWGYEYLVYGDKNVSAWILSLNKDCLTSMHCHVDKKTALLILKGEAICCTLDNGFNLKAGDGVLLDKKVFHSTQAISEEGVMLIEVETPTKKTDLIRLLDNYGRQNKGYESRNEMSKDFDKYDYAYFKNEELDKSKKVGVMDLIIKRFATGEDFKSYFEKETDGNFVLLDGKLLDSYGENLFGVGDMFSLEELNKMEEFSIDKSIKVLHIHKSE